MHKSLNLSQMVQTNNPARFPHTAQTIRQKELNTLYWLKNATQMIQKFITSPHTMYRYEYTNGKQRMSGWLVLVWVTKQYTCRQRAKPISMSGDRKSVV